MAGRMTGQYRRPKADWSEGGRMGRLRRNYLPFIGRMSGHGQTNGEGGSIEGQRRGNFQR